MIKANGLKDKETPLDLKELPITLPLPRNQESDCNRKPCSLCKCEGVDTCPCEEICLGYGKGKPIRGCPCYICKNPKKYPYPNH
jgi:hypothetical protein